MNLEEKIMTDLKQAMKDKDKKVLETLRGVKGAYQLEAINNKKEVNDELILSVISKQIKMRQDGILEFEKFNRNDLKESYQEEINILKKYMPQELTIEELDKIIDEVFDTVKPTSIKDLGQIMKVISPKVKNRCDMKLLNEKIKQKLENN